MTLHQVQEQTTALHQIPYNVSEPVDKHFNAVEDLVDLAEHDKVPMSKAQKVSMAYLLLVPHLTLQHDLCVWNDKPQADRTWEIMIVHLCTAQSHLHAFPTTGSLYQQANTLSLLTELVAQRLIEGIDTLPAPPPPVDQADAIRPQEITLLALLETLITGLSNHHTSHLFIFLISWALWHPAYAASSHSHFS